jgi:predicted nuclease with RNAse H fold
VRRNSESQIVENIETCRHERDYIVTATCYAVYNRAQSCRMGLTVCVVISINETFREKVLVFERSPF